MKLTARSNGQPMNRCASAELDRSNRLGTRSGILVVMLALAFSWPACVSIAQDEMRVGERVMVVQEGAQFRVQGGDPTPAPLGMTLKVSQVDGPWLWFKGQRGWIKQNDVVPRDQAIDYFTDQINRNPTSQGYHHRGIGQAALDKFDRAVTDFTEAIRRDANNVAAYNDRGNARRKLGRWDEALADFGAAIERGARHPAVYTNRGLVRHEQGNYDQALADFNAALQIDPQFAPAWEAGGAARQAKRDDSKAIANYRRAIEIDPDFDRALNNLAWLLATHADAQLRDAAAAVRHATKANELTNYSDAEYLDTLAAVLAETGQFEQAIRRAKEAIDKAPDEQKSTIEARLNLYEEGKPFRVSRVVESQVTD